MSKISGHKKSPVAPTTRDLETNAVLSRKNVMDKHTTAVSNVIPFRSTKLLLIERDGQPFVPMKPVVEGMGLAWASQTVKLNSNKARWGVSMIETPSASGIQQHLCIPLKKLFGWLMTLHPSKVREDIREEILAYQNECDDALWAYWNEGVAARNDSRTAASVLSTTIGTDGFHCLAAVLDGKLRSFSGGAKRAAKNHIWQQVHRAFSVVRAEDIPADQMSAARNFIASYTVLEGEFIAKPASDGITLSREEASHLYHTLYNIGQIQFHREALLRAGRALQSDLLMSVFTYLHECQSHLNGLNKQKVALDERFGSKVMRGAA